MIVNNFRLSTPCSLESSRSQTQRWTFTAQCAIFQHGWPNTMLLDTTRAYLSFSPALSIAAAGESDKWRLIMLCNRSLAYTHSHLIYANCIQTRVHASDKRRSPRNIYMKPPPPPHHGNKTNRKSRDVTQCSAPFLSTPLWFVDCHMKSHAACILFAFWLIFMGFGETLSAVCAFKTWTSSWR